MIHIIIKTVLTAAVVVGVSELGKRHTAFAAMLAALPLTSLLAMLWLYTDTKDPGRIADLSVAIFWLVLPTLLFFLILPWMLRHGFNFWLSIAVSSGVMVVFYLAYAALGRKLGLPI